MKKGWIKTTLGEITESYDKTDPRKQKEDDFRYIDIGCIDNQRHEIVEAKQFKGRDAPSRARRVVRTGDVLFSTVRPYLKNITRVPEKYDGDLTSTGITVLRASPAVESDFLFYSVVRDDYIKEISGEMDGTLYPAVRDKDVYGSEIPLPPLNEQRRIVAKIEELTASSRNAKQALDAIPPLLERFRQSVLAAAFRGDLTKQWRQQNRNTEPASELLKRIRQERRRRWEQDYLEKQKAKGKQPKNDKWKAKYKDPEPIDTTDLPELPEGWCWANLEHLIVDGPQNGLYLPKSAYRSGISILRIEDYQDDWCRPLSELKQVATDEATVAKYCLKNGDLVINRVNSPSHLGKSMVVRESNLPCLFESNMMRAKLSIEILPDLCSLYLQSPAGRSRLVANAKWAVNQASINQGDVNATAVPVAPHKEQIALLNAVRNSFSRLTLASAAVLHSTNQLPRIVQSILAKAFRGELVPQDLNDEPASALLDRIRAEHDVDKKAKK